MFEKIKANSPLAWAIYFFFLAFFWILMPVIIFVAFLPDMISGFVATSVYATFFIISNIYKFNKDMKGKISGTELGYISVIKTGGKILLILKPGSGWIFPIAGVLEHVIYSIRERMIPLTLSSIKTADPAAVDYESYGLKKEDFEDDDLNIRMEIDLDFSFYYYPDEDDISRYLYNIAHEDGNEDTVEAKVAELAPGIAKAIVLAEANRRTPALINYQREEMSDIIRDKMQEAIKYPDNPKRAWGVRVPRLVLDRLGFPQAVVDKMRDKVLFNIDQYMRLKGAKVESEAMAVLGKGEAQAEMFKLKVRAVGERLLAEARGIGKAKGYEALAKALNMKEADLLPKLDALENTFKNTEKIMFAGSGPMADLFGFLPMLGNALKQSGIGENK